MWNSTGNLHEHRGSEKFLISCFLCPSAAVVRCPCQADGAIRLITVRRILKKFPFWGYKILLEGGEDWICSRKSPVTEDLNADAQ